MHPVIRIASFLVIAVSLAQLDQATLITAAIFLLLFYFNFPSIDAAKKAVRLVARLRWLFLSIIIIYAWLTPGLLLFPELGTFSPYKEGVIAGGMRVAALVIIVSTLSILVLPVERESLVKAIYWYCRPLKFAGLDEQRLVVRLMLTMDYVQQLQSIWKQSDNLEANGNGTIQNKYQRIIQLFNDVIDRAERSELTRITFSIDKSPSLVEWLIPVLMILIFLNV